MSKTKIVKSVSRTFHKAGLKLKKHSPELLVAAGVSLPDLVYEKQVLWLLPHLQLGLRHDVHAACPDPPSDGTRPVFDGCAPYSCLGGGGIPAPREV